MLEQSLVFKPTKVGNADLGKGAGTEEGGVKLTQCLYFAEDQRPSAQLVNIGKPDQSPDLTSCKLMQHQRAKKTFPIIFLR